MFTRKHYIAIAEILHQHTVPARYAMAEENPMNSTLGHITDSFAGAFEKNNPRFDRERFMRAVKTGK